MNIVPLKRIELGFIPPFYIMRLGSYINLWDENGTPLKPVIVPDVKEKKQRKIAQVNPEPTTTEAKP